MCHTRKNIMESFSLLLFVYWSFFYGDAVPDLFSMYEFKCLFGIFCFSVKSDSQTEIHVSTDVLLTTNYRNKAF